MNARTTLAKWLGNLDPERLTALLEKRDLPLAAEYRRITTLRELAEHLVTDDSVGQGLLGGTTGELELLASIAALALERHGPVAGAEAEDGPRYPWQQRKPVSPVEPADRLVPERDVLDWFERGEKRRQVEHVLELLRERALLLPALKGQLALPTLLHVRAASFDGYGRTAARRLTDAYNAPEVKRIAANLFGEGAARTRDQAQELITALLAGPARVQALVADAPARAREVLDHLVSGPPLLRTHCFVSRYGKQYRIRTPSTSSGRVAAATRAPTGWPRAGSWSPGASTRRSSSARSPARSATRVRHPAPAWNRSRSPPPRRCRPAGKARAARPPRPQPGGPNWPSGVGRPAGRDPQGGRDRRTRHPSAGQGGRGGRGRHPAVARPRRECRARRTSGRRAGPGRPGPPEHQGPQPSARLLPSDRYDAWAAAPAAGKLLPLLAAWAVVPEVLSHWPDPDETSVALMSPQDEEAVTLRTGVLRALAARPDGHGLIGDTPGYAELLVLASWFRPGLRGHLVADGTGALNAGDELLGRLRPPWRRRPC